MFRIRKSIKIKRNRQTSKYHKNGINKKNKWIRSFFVTNYIKEKFDKNSLLLYFLPMNCIDPFTKYQKILKKARYNDLKKLKKKSL